MPKLKEVSEIIESDPSLGEQITAFEEKIKNKNSSDEEVPMRLNKFLAKSGIASRRRSDELIRMAMATVNNEIILDPAYNVKESDIIKFDGKLLKIDEEKIVIAFHKPKNVITSVSDPFGRKTVMHFIKSNKRLAPIGRLIKIQQDYFF